MPPKKQHKHSINMASDESVSATILKKYFDALENEKGFASIATKLRQTVIEDGVFSEPAIKAALFEDGA